METEPKKNKNLSKLKVSAREHMGGEGDSIEIGEPGLER